MQDICLFAHFDPDDRVDDYVYRYLEKLKQLNFSIVFISTAALSQNDVQRLRADCRDVILRENAGLDFGSWSAGFAKHASAIKGRLLLANDSVYGPIGDLGTALNRLAERRADFYGMVESVEITPHLQSWFLLFEPALAGGAELSAILAQPFSAMSKREIIEHGEVDLTRRLTQAGFRYKALSRYDPAALARRHDVNPMLLFWRELLFEKGVPFLKIELLRDNPIGGQSAAAILEAVQEIDPCARRQIEAHLARVRPRPQRSALARVRYAMIRRHYELRRERKAMASALHDVKLEIFTAGVWTFRFFKRGFRRGDH